MTRRKNCLRLPQAVSLTVRWLLIVFICLLGQSLNIHIHQAFHWHRDGYEQPSSGLANLCDTSDSFRYDARQDLRAWVEVVVPCVACSMVNGPHVDLRPSIEVAWIHFLRRKIPSSADNSASSAFFLS
jgi:hypothetical protein